MQSGSWRERVQWVLGVRVSLETGFSPACRLVGTTASGFPPEVGAGSGCLSGARLGGGGSWVMSQGLVRVRILGQSS